MDKKKLINEIIDLVDKVDELERENAELKKEKAKKEVSFEDLEIAGKKKLFEYVKSYSLDYSYSVEKGGKLITLFEWLDTLDMGIFSSSYCKDLNNHSMKELVGYFIDELDEIYNAKLDKIKQELKEKEEHE